MRLRTPLETVEAIRLVRRFAKGFRAKDGFDIRSIKAFGRKAITPYKRKKLQRYFDVVNFNQAEPHIIKRPRNKKRLRSLQEFSQHEDYPKDLNVAFVPIAVEADSAKIIWKNNKVKKVIQEGYARYTIDFNKKQFVSNPAKEIDRALATTDSKYFFTQAGKHVIYQKGGSAKDIKKEVLALMNKYGDDRFDSKDTNSHYYGNWLNGIIGFNFDDSSIDKTMQFRDYIVEYRNERYSERSFRDEMRSLLRNQQTAIENSKLKHKPKKYRSNQKKKAKQISRQRVEMQINHERAKRGKAARIFD